MAKVITRAPQFVKYFGPLLDALQHAQALTDRGGSAMPQTTSINFWRINRRLQEESRILREAFRKDFQESRKVIACAQEKMESIKSPNSLSHRGEPLAPQRPTKP
jgi:hypothetical protein